MDDETAAEIARVIAADADCQIDLGVPEGAEVHFVGRPILALNRATNNLTLPRRFLHNPFVEDRYCFSLPRALWDEVYNRLGPESFDTELVAFEDTMSEICGDHSQQVGFWRGRAFSYHFLCRLPSLRLCIDDMQPDGMQVNQAQLDHAVRTYEDRMGSLAKVPRAYAGWLMINPQFLDEHDALFAQWATMVGRWGLDRLGILVPRGMYLRGDDPNADPCWPAYQAAFHEFFARWRLQGLAAPYLPVPLQPLMGGQVPLSILPQLMLAGGVFLMPDTSPIPSRDTLRGMLDDALHNTAASEHLAGWMKIIASDKSAKTPLIKFARQFGVQHYYRILQHRHASALNGKLTVVKELLASFLGTHPRTIHADLMQLNKFLGKDWIHRGSEAPLGPFSSNAIRRGSPK